MQEICMDQCGWEVLVVQPVQRIVSLVPSQTELLFDLGLNERVVGITKFCIHPNDWFRTKTRIGGTKNPDLEKIDTLNPDLIIANKEENRKEDIEQLAKKFPVWVSDIYTIDDALTMIHQVGRLCQTMENADRIAANISQLFEKLIPPHKTKSAVYLIWRNPWMSVNERTFIHNIMHRCGFENLLLNHPSRYPTLSSDELASLNPELILLSSEPYPFKEKHIAEIKALCPGAKILLVDGEMFSWYGSRLLHAPAYLQQLIERLDREAV
ncbi:MAG: helical backbone metal receptor [Flavobacteriales bacterium]